MKKTLLILLILLLGMLRPEPASALDMEALQTDLHGFLDARYGRRLQADPYERDTSLAETRLQLHLVHQGEAVTAEIRSDFLYDDVSGISSPDLEKGTGWIDLREAYLLFSPVPMADVKVGRQILTWGTGDLVFINDLFPKDWQAFFSGRDVDYLKAPSDAVLLSLFPGPVNIDVVYTPRFDADRFISGERLSYWNPLLDRRAGEDAIIDPVRPDDWFEDDEIALRLSKVLGGYELALYGYDGFWKSPNGFDADTLRAAFAKLRVYGASARGAFLGGIANAEAGYYDSREDHSGDDPYLPNSEFRLLFGYERELVRNLSLGLQYYLEVLQDYPAYRSNLPDGQPDRDEDRHVVTLRLTKLAMNQNLNLSLFLYVSPSDEDYYVRPTVSYKMTDAWLLTAGANLFGGEKDYTFFGQFKKDTNVYAGIRYSF